MKPLSLEQLTSAVNGDIAAFRAKTRLQPIGGEGDKVFPPTYATAERAPTKYAMETRRVAGEEVETVLLDSVASQANRMELGLLEGWDLKELRFPMLYVDFSDAEGAKDLGHLSTLEAPHRIADALFRDSELNGQLFRFTDVGRAYTDARVSAATAVYQYCPTALVFGVWDSTGPKGGLGAKFPRALVSEIVGFNATRGVKVGSRLDPAGIESGVKIYEHKDQQQHWTLDAAEAKKTKGKPTLSKEGGKPSGINHGNIAPSIVTDSGGVTIDYAEQTTVLSLAVLRRLRFPKNVTDEAVDAGERRAAETAARTNLAALALAGMAYHRAVGFDLRSRCQLVPDPGGPLVIEAVPRDGGAPERYSLDISSAAKLLTEAQAQAKRHGFGWAHQPIVLKPAAKLVALINSSRMLSKTKGDD